MSVLQGLAVLLLCQSAGEAVARLAHLPLPGPVVGMLVLMGLLQVLFGALRLGKFIRMVPFPVMVGFVNGLAIVIGWNAAGEG